MNSNTGNRGGLPGDQKAEQEHNPTQAQPLPEINQKAWPKSSRATFMTLPFEIRLMILGYTFEGFPNPSTAKITKHNRVWRINGYSFQPTEWQFIKDGTDDYDDCNVYIQPNWGVAEIRRHMQPSIALVNRKLRDETLFHFYKTTSFSFAFTDVLDPETGYPGLMHLVGYLESQERWGIRVVKVVVPMLVEDWRHERFPLISDSFE